MTPKIELSGMKFGRLSVTPYWERAGKAKFLWLCICDCGAEKLIRGDKLRKGHTRSCGCLHRDLLIERNKSREIPPSSRAARARPRKQRKTDKSEDRRGRNSRTHGCAGKDHRTWTAEYRAWVSMKTRCSNRYVDRADYKNYYGRGIRICERWLESFENFLADVGRRPSRAHSLDRINNDGNYEPGNVRWATWREQRMNQRPRSRRAAA